MMGNMTKATPVIIFNVRSLDVASHKVKLWLGSKLDGMMKGNIAKPAVKIIQAFVTLAQTKVIASFFHFALRNTPIAIIKPPIGANHIHG